MCSPSSIALQPSLRTIFVCCHRMQKMRKNILSRHQSHCEQLIFREYLFRITSSLQTLVMVNVTRLLTDSDLHGHIEYVGKYANSKIKWSHAPSVSYRPFAGQRLVGTDLMFNIWVHIWRVRTIQIQSLHVLCKSEFFLVFV